MKNNNSSGTNGMHNPSSVTAIPLTREHYMVIGNPRGKISDTNPNGLSKQQMHTIKSILIYESDKNKNCKYVHKIMSEQQKKDTGYDKDRKDSNKKT